MLRVCAALAALAAGGTARADDAALAELRAAVEVAERHGAGRYAFTLDFRDEAESDAKTFRVRFDPRQPAGARWTAIEPPADRYGKDERAAFKRMTRNDDADDALIYDGLADAIAEARLIAADARRATFSVPISDPKTPQAVKEALTATATLDRERGFISAIEVSALKPFKPAAVAKVDAMRQLQRYERLEPDGPALLVSSESDTEGSAMLRSFKSKARLTYSEIEKVDAPPRPAAR